LHLMQRMLRLAGFPVYISVNAEDIDKKIAISHPAVILLDIHMNGISGEDICRKLKTNVETAEIPLLLVSSNEDIQQVAKNCGANGFIPKTVALVELKKRLLPFLSGAA
jgi:CheY-like chemotaxis protein